MPAGSFADRADCLPNLLSPASRIFAAYVSNNYVARGELPALLAGAHAELMRISGQTPASSTVIIERPSADSIRSSLTHDGIRSFLDGRIYQTLKRHLGCHGLTPAAYRQTYGLPLDYPMSAPAYSERRTAFAKAIGLSGTRPTKTASSDDAPVKRRREAA